MFLSIRGPMLPTVLWLPVGYVYYVIRKDLRYCCVDFSKNLCGGGGPFLTNSQGYPSTIRVTIWRLWSCFYSQYLLIAEYGSWVRFLGGLKRGMFHATEWIAGQMGMVGVWGVCLLGLPHLSPHLSDYSLVTPVNPLIMLPNCYIFFHASLL